MKFTKEKAYEELVAKMTAKGEKLNLSERSINEQLENLIKLIVNDETELSDFVEKVLPLIKTADSNVRHDVSAGITEFKNTYVPPKPTKKDDKDGDKEGDKDDDAKYNALLEKITALEKKEQENASKEKIATLRKDFIDKIKEKGVNDDEWLDGYINEITMTEDFDVDARLESCLKLYNKSKSIVNTDITPKGGGGKPNANYIKDVVAKAAAMADAERGIVQK